MRTFGPFQTVAEFNDFLIHAAKVGISRDGLAQIRPQMSDTHRVVFTHGDLAPRNIFVKGGQVVAIIDWEESGWFPEHWQCVKAWWCPGLDKDWDAMIPDFVPQNYEEAVRVDQMLSDRMMSSVILSDIWVDFARKPRQKRPDEERTLILINTTPPTCLNRACTPMIPSPPTLAHMKCYLLCLFFEAVRKLTPRSRKRGSIVLLPFGLVLKVGLLSPTEEGRTIRYIQSNTDIPVPKVLIYATGLFRNYTLMKRVDGDLLQFAWHDLTPEDQTDIIRQLRTIVQSLRALQPPEPPSVSSLGNGPCRDSRVAGIRLFGPFPSVAKFNDFLIDAAEIYMDPDALPGIRAQMSDTSRIVCTHGDLAPRNIFVKGGKIVAIIDWEESGWFPEHWEYVKARWCSGLDKSWNERIPEFIPEDYENDLRVDKLLSDRMVGAI
ncbi:hypothetical protein Hypma_012967 [Hypsizygus marmoreus]|uniref:Aminoglycoside phosphotransferase domain-containing protein n=1 Tax=Hypsizygus marmoreus TaxID=39966 RepID=A0A369JKI3_HYPMA|nr:hypothetical protein Hypma_012967 [Hypsizygus marmoreus]